MRRYGEIEIRDAEGGPHLHGVLIQEGRAASGGRREVFAPGSVEWPSAGVGILTAHRAPPEVRAVPVRESDGRISIRARATDPIREAVQAGKKWMSVEFHALRERTTRGGVREVLQALVPRVALVADPEYDTTTAEVRRRIGGASGGFSEGGDLDCRCGFEDCDQARVEPGGLQWDDTTIGVFGDYKRVLGSVGAGTLRVARRGKRIEVDVDVPDTSWGRDVLALAGAAPLIWRPYPDPERSEYDKDGRVMVYSSLFAAAFVLVSTDQVGGFDEVETEDRGRRRVWL